MKKKYLCGIIAGLCMAANIPILANAHYIQSHLKVLELAEKTLKNDSNPTYQLDNQNVISFLMQEESPGNMYFEYILDGSRDADLLGNGLAGITLTCKDYTTGAVVSDNYTYYNDEFDYGYRYKNLTECTNTQEVGLSGWYVGDHMYKSDETGNYAYLLDNDMVLIGAENSVYDENITWERFKEIATHDFNNEINSPIISILEMRFGEISSITTTLDDFEIFLKTTNAKEMAKEFYQRAKDSWSDSLNPNSRRDAMYNLGIVVHLVQDMTVPSHVSNIVQFEYQQDENAWFDYEFEKAIWNDYLLQEKYNLPDFQMNYECFNIDELIEITANETRLTYDDQWLNNIENSGLSFNDQDLGNSIRLAVTSTASLLRCFFLEVGSANEPIIMEGNFVKTAISENGTLGYGGNTSPGIFHDPTGQRNFGPDDYLTPGSPWELFTVDSDQTGVTINNNNSGGDNGTIPKVNLSNLSYKGDFDNYVTWTGQYLDYFTINHEYHFDENDEKIDIVTKITALQDLTNLKFLRSIDPDPDVYTYGIWDTDNRQGFDSNNDGDFSDNGDISPEDWVHAEGKNTGLTIGLYSTASYYHNTGVSSGWSSDPDIFLTGQNDGDWDYTIGLAFEFGDLVTGESVTFNYAYVMGELVEVADIPWIPSQIYETPTQPELSGSGYTPPSTDEGFIIIMSDFYSSVIDFTKSLTGVVDVIVDPDNSILDKLEMQTGSPAWGVFKLDLSEPVNHLSFNFAFTSNAEGLLKVFFDSEEVFVADERIFNQGEIYGAAIDLPEIPAGVHTLSYRLDSFDDTQVVIEITEIQTGTVEEIVYPTGDFNNDTVVDRLDINVLNTHLNQPATVCPECDLTGDGTINILDTRTLMGLCTYPRCASN